LFSTAAVEENSQAARRASRSIRYPHLRLSPLGDSGAQLVMGSVSSAKARDRTRLDGVDLLRALAIFFVLMNHVNIRLLIARVPYLAHVPRLVVDALVWNAQRGVQMFFAVSGFLITSTALRRWNSISGVNIRDFYLLRFARIAPLLLLILAVLSALHLGQVNHYVVTEKTGGLPRAILAALTFHVNVLEARRGYLPGSWDILWSLSVEEMFYLFFPIVCYIVRNTRAFVLLLLGFVVLGPFSRSVWAHGSEIWREYSYLGSMDAIALGCLTAILVSRRKLSRQAIQTVAIVGSAFLMLCLGFSFTSFNRALERGGLDMSVLALGTCLVIIAAEQARWNAPPGLHPILNLGRRSYEIYLTHMFVVFLAFDLFLKAGKPMAGVPIFFLAVILAGAALGELVARYYSEPLNRAIRLGFSRRYRSLGSVIEEQKRGETLALTQNASINN
jgi:peptidoglycan/LPS O-acetylase OafA/YrhL